MRRTLTIILSLTILRSLAQVGTWHHHLAYYDVQDIQKAGNRLFVLASNGLYQYHLGDQSITTYDKTSGLSDTYITHIAWSQQAKRLIAVYQNSNIDLIDTDGEVTNISALYKKTTTEDKTVRDVRIDGSYAYLVTGLGVLKVNLQRAEISETYTTNHPNYPTSLPERNTADYEQYRSLVESLRPIGPKYNYFYESRFYNGTLYTTGGYFLSGMPNPHRPGIVQTFDGNDWTVYQEDVEQTTGYNYINMCSIDAEPNDATHVFAGGQCGLYEFRDGKLVNYYNKENSPLKGVYSNGKELGNNYVLIPAIKMDNKGNLWVLNGEANGKSLFSLSPNGEWTDHHHPNLANSDDISLATFRSAFFDSRGLLWFVNDNWLAPAVFCYDPRTETAYRYDVFRNQDGTTYKINWVYCVAEDYDGNIWVGTDSGLFMIQREEVLQESVTYYQVKIPRNDGTNYADYLLSGVNISSIAIDGANRKWIGTNGAGVFLISSDNMEQLQHFTPENSPLISSNITHISINHQKSEVFFLSDNGLCSYQSDATAPHETMDKNTVVAYPNPVTPDYTGLITITGLSYDADVKILSASGALVAEGRSNGGMFTWNGKDQEGHHVASGVYMVATATNSGSKGTVCKIAIIR